MGNIIMFTRALAVSCMEKRYICSRLFPYAMLFRAWVTVSMFFVLEWNNSSAIHEFIQCCYCNTFEAVFLTKILRRIHVKTVLAYRSWKAVVGDQWDRKATSWGVFSVREKRIHVRTSLNCGKKCLTCNILLSKRGAVCHWVRNKPKLL